MEHPNGMITTDYHPSEVYEPNAFQIADAKRRANDWYEPKDNHQMLTAAIVCFVAVVFGIFLYFWS